MNESRFYLATWSVVVDTPYVYYSVYAGDYNWRRCHVRRTSVSLGGLGDGSKGDREEMCNGKLDFTVFLKLFLLDCVGLKIAIKNGTQNNVFH